MKKRLFGWILTVTMAVSALALLPVSAFAATSGTCGTNLTWTLSTDGTLTISGIGKM